MDLDNYSDYSAASTGPPEKIEVFQNLKLNFLVKGYLEHIFSHKEEYPILGISLKWQILLLQIRSLVVSAFDDYFRIKDWLPQSSFIVDDILFQVFNVHAHEWIDIMGQLAESLDALINRFFQVESYGNIRSFPILAARSRGQSRQYRRELKDFLQTRTLVYRLESTTSNASGEERRRRRRRASDTHSDSDFETYSYYVITELPRDELERSVNALTKRLSVSKIILPNDPSYRMPPQIFTCLSWIQNPTALRLLRIGIRCLAPVNLLSSCGRHLHHLIIKLDDSGEIDESISFGADVLPTLQTLVVVIDKMDKSTKSFHALSRSVFSPTLSCIRIWFPEIRRWDEEDCRGLDDTFVQLPRQIRIEIEKRYWKGLPKLKSKGVLVIPTTERGE
ncbi:hypothetical protein ABKN59_011337 [Abortiporus biennis]